MERSQELLLPKETRRWAAFGPYYAMFPLDFAYSKVQEYTIPGQTVLDPFSGRGSSIFAAAALDREGIGIEINPVGWLFGKIKLNPSSASAVLNRLSELNATHTNSELSELPAFFHGCFTKDVLSFLLAARKLLKWRKNMVDATLMGFILVYLHGKKGQALSSQMRQTKAMAPDYSLRWWKSHGELPPEIDPHDFLEKRIEWRYKMGKPCFKNSKNYLGDSLKVLLRTRIIEHRFDFMLTSPPYYDVTDYHYDQWLRYWMLGGPSLPVKQTNPSRSRFRSKEQYKQLLDCVFQKSSKLMNNNAVIYVRTDARDFTFSTTLESLKKAFPKKDLEIKKQPFRNLTQTALFGDKANKPGEIDIIMH